MRGKLFPNIPHLSKDLEEVKDVPWILNYDFVEKLGPGTKSKSKGEALGQSISLNLVYRPIPPQTPNKLLGHFQGT